MFQNKSMHDLDNNGCHVVTTKSLGRSQVRSTALVHEFLNSILEFLHGSLLATVVAAVNGLVAELNSFLGSHHIPDTVTGQKNELGVVGNGHGLDVGEGSHNLVLNLEH